MPKYIIHCSTTRSYRLTVEAPNEEHLTDWDVEIIVVDNSGEVLLKETLDTCLED